MNERTFKATIIFIAAAFTAIFLWLVIPAQMANPDIIGAFAAGFVNPYSSGYSTDVFACWFILVAWIVYEARTHSIRHGWICAILGIVPGVAVGFALYLLMRMAQLKQRPGIHT
jgi:hypothetical protein